MSTVIKAKGLTKIYKDKVAVDHVDLEVGEGKIVGLIGPNGAGKTTVLRSLLGLAEYEGELEVLGKNPRTDRVEMLKEVAFIADTAVLPSWITVAQLLEYMEFSHPNFSREKAEEFLSITELKPHFKVKTLSKGMVTQLHLSLVISINARLLVLDEPTLGLDIIYRKRFYEQLLNDYFDENRTILITTHQVEEIEQILTDLIFIKRGSVNLDIPMSEVEQRFMEVEVHKDQLELARSKNPIYERTTMGGKVLLFENHDRELLSQFGKVKTPSVSDLFVAKMQN